MLLRLSKVLAVKVLLNSNIQMFYYSTVELFGLLCVNVLRIKVLART